jgi:hypothetical protein
LNNWTNNPNVTEQTRNAIAWGRKVEREHIIALIRETYGEDYYEMGVCGQIVALIRADEVSG